MYNVKISYNGKNTQMDTNVEFSLTTSFKEDELEVMLGKAIYAMEVSGAAINTHELYTEVMEGIAETKIANRWKKYIDRPEIVISISKSKD